MTAVPDTNRRLFAREARPVEAPGSGPDAGGAGETGDLLRALLAVNGRIAFPEVRLRSLVSPTGASAYWTAYGRCDGRTSLTDIAKEAGLDLGNLSRAVTKWVEIGIAFRIGPKRFPLHLYLLSIEDTKGRASAKASAVGVESVGPTKRAAKAERSTERSVDSGAPEGRQRSAAATADSEASPE